MKAHPTLRALILLVLGTVLASPMCVRAEQSPAQSGNQSPAAAAIHSELAHADAATLRAAAAEANARNKEYTVSARGADHRVMQRVTYSAVPGIGLVPQVHSYTELATGMHYRDGNGEWQESKEEISLLPNGAGATARQGRHKAIFPPDIHDGFIELQLPDGNWQRSQVLGLGYYDSATGRSVLLAELTNTVGELHAPNQILYADAFTDVKADVRYTYTLAGFEQDIILREQPPAPGEFGLSPETTKLEVLTEFLETPAPKQTDCLQKSGRLSDVTLDFGSMRMSQGKAFVLGQEGATTPVGKSWQVMEGRTVLVEGVEVREVAAQLESLPVPSVAKLKSQHPSLKSLVSVGRKLPAKHIAKQSGAVLRVASASQNRAGLVLDYVSLSASEPDFTTFQGDTTYYIAGHTVLYDTITFEGGTIIKFATNAWLWTEYVQCKTGPYRPIVMTSKDDNTVGEVIGGSTAVPSGYYGSWKIPSDTSLDHVRAKSMDIAFDFTGDSLFMTNVQVLDSSTFAKQGGSCGIHVYNGLVARCQTLISPADDSTFTGTHMTVARCGNELAGGAEYNHVFLTNTLLVNATNFSFGVGDNTDQVVKTNVALTNFASIFKSVYGGEFYLTATNPCRAFGTADLGTNLLAQLRTKTTQPPLAYTNFRFTNEMTFPIHAVRDTNASPDIGFHYDPIDFMFGGVISTSNLTFNAGVVAAWFPSTNVDVYSDVGDDPREIDYFADFGYECPWGIQESDFSTITFAGRAGARCGWVHFSTAQENGTRVVDGVTGAPIQDSVGITGRSRKEMANTAQVNATFTTFSVLGREWTSHCRDDWGRVRLATRHCEFYNGAVGQFATGLRFTNALLNRLTVYAMGNLTDISELIMRNCTWVGGHLGVEHFDNAHWPVSVHNTAFDKTVIISDDPDDEPTSADYDFNAFLDGYDQTYVVGTNCLTNLVDFEWQTGPFDGGFYLSTNSPLVDAGDGSSTDYTVNWFTTVTNGTPDTNGVVDVGFHYPAISGNNLAYDNNGDGIANPVAHIEIPQDLAIAPTNISGGGIQTGLFLVTMSDSVTPPLPVNRTLHLKTSGSARLGVDYVLTNDNGTNITENVTIPAGQYDSHLTVVPLYHTNVQFEETVILSLMDDENYYISPSMPSGTVVISNHFQTNVITTVALNSRPGSVWFQQDGMIGIDFSPTTNSLIISANFNEQNFTLSGLPFSFMRVGTNDTDCGTNRSLVAEQWSQASNVLNEIKLAVVNTGSAIQGTNSAGFTNGDMFFGNTTNIGWVRYDGTVFDLNWATLADGSAHNTNALRGGLYVDRTGVFSNQLVVVAGDSATSESKGIWLVDAQKHARLITNINTTHLEGVITITNDVAKWGPWAGKILTGNEDTKKIFAIGSCGCVEIFDTKEFYPGGLRPEDFDIIPPAQDFYACDVNSNRLMKVSRSLLNENAGNLLITEAGEAGAGASLSIVRWDGTNFSVRKITYVRPNGNRGRFEHGTFAPIDLPSN